MTLLSAVPSAQRPRSGESLCVSVHAEDGAAVTWWRDGVKVADGNTLVRADLQTADSGTYVVRAVKGTVEEIHAVPVAVAPPDRSISVELPRTWRDGTARAALIIAVAVAAGLASGPAVRAVRLSGADDGRPDAALIAQVATASGVLLLVAGAFVGVMTALTRAQADQPAGVHADGVDPATVARLVSSLYRPRVTAILLGAGLLLIALAAVLAWRLADAVPPTRTAAGAALTCSDARDVSGRSLSGQADGLPGCVVAVEQDGGDALVGQEWGGDHVGAGARQLVVEVARR
jgi:hypothetical protein